MRNKLLEVLGKDYKVDEWHRSPVKAWGGFTVNDMYELGYHAKVQKWLDGLTTEEIKGIYNDGNGIKNRRKGRYQFIDELSD
jgi:hypothetical protein